MTGIAAPRPRPPARGHRPQTLKASARRADHLQVTAAVLAGGTTARSPVPSRRIGAIAVRLLALGIAMLVVPNLVILGLHALAQRNAATPSVSVPITNFAQVDDRLWRGGAPKAAGLESLAANGVTTVIDLRAEDDIQVDEALYGRLGLVRVHLPMRDGQTPTDDQVSRFLATVESSGGRAFVHCGAGVGRTGTMSAAYLVKTGQTTPSEALQRNLSVGPPSLEQLAFASGLSPAGVGSRPGGLMVAISRTLDAPRRIWTNVRP